MTKIIRLCLHKSWKSERLVYTPTHGPVELSILQRDCLNRHIATKEVLIAEISAWQTKRNAKQAKANWQFTTKDARIKLHKLYPTV